MSSPVNSTSAPYHPSTATISQTSSPGSCCSRRRPPCVGWIERCSYPNSDEQGEWLSGDEITPSLREALGAMGRDAAPMILDTVRAVEDWADSRPADARELPRAVGTCATSLRGISLERGALGYSLLSVQRVVDAYRELDPADRKRADENLAGTGWEAVLVYEPRHRLTRDDYQLVFE